MTQTILQTLNHHVDPDIAAVTVMTTNQNIAQYAASSGNPAVLQWIQTNYNGLIDAGTADNSAHKYKRSFRLTGA